MTEEDKIKKHYLLERELADRIRRSHPAERKQIVSEAYRTLYEEIPWHISRNKNKDEALRVSEFYISLLLPLLRPDALVLELGCGSCQMINIIGTIVSSAWGLDTTLVKSETTLNPNIRLVESDVSSFDLGNTRFDLIYSIHLIEHLHPDDVQNHLYCIYRHLKPGGKIFISTPNAFSGPHDISKYFDDYPTGFHLKEYTYKDLAGCLKECGFNEIKTQLLVRQKFKFKYNNILYRFGLVPVWTMIWIERILSHIPSRKIQRQISMLLKIINMNIVATKA